MCERNLQLITERCHILMFVYFLWSAAFACAVKMRAHSAFSDRGTGVIVSPDERRSVCNFGSVFGSLWVQVWSRFSVNKPPVTFLAHWSGMFMFWVFLNIYFKAGQNVFNILCTEFRSYKLVFQFHFSFNTFSTKSAKRMEGKIVFRQRMLVLTLHCI